MDTSDLVTTISKGSSQAKRSHPLQDSRSKRNICPDFAQNCQHMFLNGHTRPCYIHVSKGSSQAKRSRPLQDPKGKHSSLAASTPPAQLNNQS